MNRRLHAEIGASELLYEIVNDLNVRHMTYDAAFIDDVIAALDGYLRRTGVEVETREWVLGEARRRFRGVGVKSGRTASRLILDDPVAPSATLEDEREET